MGNESPYWEWYGVFNSYIVIDDHCYDGNHINGIIDLADKWIMGPMGSMVRLKYRSTKNEIMWRKNCDEVGWETCISDPRAIGQCLSETRVGVSDDLD